MVLANEWLEENYPKKETCIRENEYIDKKNNRVKLNNFGKKIEEIKKLKIDSQNLEGALNLFDFIDLEELNCSNNQLTQLILPTNNKLKKINCSKNQLNNLDLNNHVNLEYLNCCDNQLISLILPACSYLTELLCCNNKLVILDMTNHYNLKKLWCNKNQITQLILPRFNQLAEIYAYNNFLTSFDFNELNSQTLTNLDLENNNLEPIDISIFNRLINLEWLSIGNSDEQVITGNYNKIYGSLNSLKNLAKLKNILSISNTHIDEKWEPLPENLEVFCYSKKRYQPKIPEITTDYSYIKWLITVKKKHFWWLLEKEKEMTLKKEYLEFLSQRLLDNPSDQRLTKCSDCEEKKVIRGWCNCCNSKIFEKKFKNWTSGSKEVDIFLQKYQINANFKNEILEWIPYDQFTEIKFLAKGGFSKVYEAKWTNGGPIEKWDKERNQWKRKTKGKNHQMNIVLKVIDKSKNMNNDFLQEISRYKILTDSVNFFVNVYGISKEPISDNFLIVMDYVEDGNLRQNLRFCYDGKCEIDDKITRLHKISNSLRSIHEMGFVHRDLHPGNILIKESKALVTDLGLSRPINEFSEDKLYGVLPYIAPEVLKDRSYTSASDVYSFGMIAYEVFSEKAVYHDLVHDWHLAKRICEGFRPDFEGVQIPQMWKDVIRLCWDFDPSKRPNAEELRDISSATKFNLEKFEASKEVLEKNLGIKWDLLKFSDQCRLIDEKKKNDLCKALSRIHYRLKGEFREITEENYTDAITKLFLEFCHQKKYDHENIMNKYWQEILNEPKKNFHNLILSELTKNNDENISYSQAIYTSRAFDFNNLPQPKNNLSEEWQESVLLEMQDKGIENEIKFFEEKLKEIKIKLKCQNSSDIDTLKYREKLSNLKIKSAEIKLKCFRPSLDYIQKPFFDKFVTLRQEFLQDKRNKKKEYKNFKEKAKEILSEELINEIEQICDKLFELEKENQKQALIEQPPK